MTTRRFCTILPFFLIAVCIPAYNTAYAQNNMPTYEARDVNGNPVSLDDLSGSPVLVNVWATWCEPCRRELPYLQSLHEAYSSDGLRVVGASIDAADDSLLVKNFASNMGMTYDIWLDPNDKATFAFRMIGVPETVLLDPDGAVIKQWRGPIEPGMGVETLIEDALGIRPEQPGDTSLVIAHGIRQAEPAELVLAFSAGLLSFLSPCVLPLIPAYATFITGMSLREISVRRTDSGSLSKQSMNIRTAVLTRGLLFVLGFSAVFVSLGVAVSYVSSLFDLAVWIERIGGVVIIVFGLHLLGLLKIKSLYKQKSLDLSKRSTGNVGSLLVGMGFGAGWTPCIGPILAGILTVAAASSSVSAGAVLLTTYAAGLAVPFILSALAMDRFMAFLHVARRWMGWFERITGIVLIGMGVLLLTGSLSALAAIFGESLTGSQAPG